VPARRLVLGKHSGATPIARVWRELGYETTDTELADAIGWRLYSPTPKREITDRDLVGIIHKVRRNPSLPRPARAHYRERTLKPDGKHFMTGLRKTIAVLPGDGIGRK